MSQIIRKLPIRSVSVAGKFHLPADHDDLSSSIPDGERPEEPVKVLELDWRHAFDKAHRRRAGDEANR
jgi:hypothetical protein